MLTSTTTQSKIENNEDQSNNNSIISPTGANLLIGNIFLFSNSLHVFLELTNNLILLKKLYCKLRVLQNCHRI